MTDDLSPVEQARAARWAADWLVREGWAKPYAAATGAVSALLERADQLDPPESVESLRAERDAARVGAKGWEHRAVEFRRYWLGVRQELDAANDTIARLRATHTQAEAAWGRCQRED